MEFVFYILIFWIGWLCSSLWNYLFNLGKAAIMMRHITYTLACFIKLMHEASLQFMDIKYTGLRENNTPEDIIKKLRLDDETAIRETQKTILNLMIEKYPEGFIGMLEFKNWHEMKNYIEKYQRRSDA